MTVSQMASSPLLRWLTATSAVTMTLMGCARDDSTTQVTVFAAASLTGTFDELARSFEGAHPGTEVTLVLGGSAGLATQIVNGAPADVFASAASAHMATVVEAGFAQAPTPFASNRMRIAVPDGNPARVRTVADLARPGVTVAVCQPKTPCGAGAETVFANAGITVRPVTEEPDVKAALAKVTLGEVDAAMVYVTDVPASAPDVRGITIPAQVNTTTDYLITTIADSQNAQTATRFVNYVTSQQGLRVLADAGFGPPEPSRSPQQ